MRWVALLLPLVLAARAVAAPEAVVVTTEHYALTAETSRAEAEALARVLESAWPGYEAFFGKAPKLAKEERLSVVFCASQASFAARLRAAGVDPPAAGGYYHPGDRTAYAWRQPTIYYTRCLLLHEALHQFHYLARTDNRSTLQGWYAEGLAEHLCRHTWDGETLALGVIPPLSLKDYPRAALEALRADDADLRVLLADATLSRPVAWAVVTYLVTGNARSRRQFAKIASKLDRGSKDADLLFDACGGPTRLAKAVRAWLPAVQEPWAQVFNEWEGTAEGCFRGTAGPGIVSTCRAKADATSIAAELVVPEEGPWRAGLLLSHAGNDDYTVALVTDAGEVLVHRRRGGAWERILEIARSGLDRDGRVSLAADRAGETVTLRVGGADVGSFDLPGAAFGLALQGGTASFREVRVR